MAQGLLTAAFLPFGIAAVYWVLYTFIAPWFPSKLEIGSLHVQSFLFVWAYLSVGLLMAQGMRRFLVGAIRELERKLITNRHSSQPQ